MHCGEARPPWPLVIGLALQIYGLCRVCSQGDGDDDNRMACQRSRQVLDMSCNIPCNPLFAAAAAAAAAVYEALADCR